MRRFRWSESGAMVDSANLKIERLRVEERAV